MNQTMCRRGTRRLAMIALGLCLATATPLWGEDLFIQPDQLEVRDGPGLLFDLVDTVKRNDKVSMLEKTDDGWIKVQTPAGKQGYVFQNSVSGKQAAGPSFIDGFFGTSNANAAKLGTAAAAKGLEPESATYAASKNLSTAALDTVTKSNKAVKGKDWVQFCQDGKVGPARPKSK